MPNPELAPLSQEVIDRQTETRILSDAQLIKDGAAIVDGVLSPSGEQYEAIIKEIEGLPKTSQQVGSQSTPEAMAPAISEQEYRAQLLEQCLEKSKGSVSAFASMPTDDKRRNPQDRYIRSEFIERAKNAGRKTLADRPDSGGWMNFGEVEYPDKEIKYDHQPDSEEMYFGLPDDEDSVQVSYRFSAPEYTDPTNRPGQELKVGFKLPVELADRLEHASYMDASVARELVEAQILALGYPERAWSRGLRPPYEGLESWAIQRGEKPPVYMRMFHVEDDGSVMESGGSIKNPGKLLPVMPVRGF